MLQNVAKKWRNDDTFQDSFHPDFPIFNLKICLIHKIRQKVNKIGKTITPCRNFSNFFLK